jgi:drug/metabolite transporter (DMT)-like permease
MATKPSETDGDSVSAQLTNTLRSGQWAFVKLFSGAVMISFSGVWVNVSDVTPTVSAFYRVFLGSLFLVAAAGVRREIRWLGTRHAAMGFLCGLFFALDLVCYHYSIHLVGPGLGTILPNLQVFILAILGSLFLNEKLHFRTIASMPAAFGGLWLVVGSDWTAIGSHHRAGITLGLTAAIFYSLFIIFLRQLQIKQRGLSIFYVLMLVSFATSLLIAPVIPITGDSFAIPNVKTAAALLALGLFSQFIGWILITNALPSLRTSLSGLILLLQPALAFVWDVLFFQRPTGLVNWIGVFIVLCAIYFAATGQPEDN